MKAAINILVLSLLIGTSFSSKAQQLPQFTQYLYNTISINPAYAGSREVMVFNLLNRNQWVGLEGAPVTQTLSIHSSIPGSKFGVGLSVVNDRIGDESFLFTYADLSYTIQLKEKMWMALGLKAGASQYKIDGDLLNDPRYISDPFLQNLNQKLIPNIGAGIYFRTESLYLGFSSPKLLTQRNNNTIDRSPIDRVNFFINGGYLFDANPNLKVKPTFLVKYTNGAPLSLDLTANVFINELLWVAGMYRLNDSVGALVNFKVTTGLSIGYAYDFVASNLNPYTSGSHEIMLNYNFAFPRPKCKCKDLYN